MLSQRSSAIAAVISQSVEWMTQWFVTDTQRYSLEYWNWTNLFYHMELSSIQESLQPISLSDEIDQRIGTINIWWNNQFGGAQFEMEFGWKWGAPYFPSYSIYDNVQATCSSWHHRAKPNHSIIPKFPFNSSPRCLSERNNFVNPEAT